MSGGRRVAALDAQGLWVETERRSVLRPVADWSGFSLELLLRGMAHHGITALHVHASALPLLGLPSELPPPPAPGERRPPHPWLTSPTYQLSTHALAPWLEAQHPSGKLEVGIGAYQVAGGDPFADAIDGAELLACVLTFADALAERGRRFYFRQSCAQTGWQLMHGPWDAGGRRRRRPLDGGPNQHPLLEGIQHGQQVEVPYGGAWALPKSKRLPSGWLVRAFDVNWQRLAACSRLRLGIGHVEHYTGELAAAALADGLPGYHRVTELRRPHRGIPAMFEPGWHTTPRVGMAQYLGLEPRVAESWVWPEHLPYLDPFYDRLRLAREQLLADDTRAGRMALAAIKQCYLQALGRLRSARLGAKHDIRWRPSWYDAVIGQELAREYLRLHQLAEAGELVLAVYFDTIICVVPEPGYVPDALECSPRPGKWKPVGGPLELADARRALYTDDGPDVGALVRALEAAGAEPPAGSLVPAPVSAAPSVHTRPIHGGYPEAAA